MHLSSMKSMIDFSNESQLVTLKRNTPAVAKFFLQVNNDPLIEYQMTKAEKNQIINRLINRHFIFKTNLYLMSCMFNKKNAKNYLAPDSQMGPFAEFFSLLFELNVFTVWTVLLVETSHLNMSAIFHYFLSHYGVTD